jgi:tetratricopeptide (TPR) repeat protein
MLGRGTWAALAAVALLACAGAEVKSTSVSTPPSPAAVPAALPEASASPAQGDAAFDDRTARPAVDSPPAVVQDPAMRERADALTREAVQTVKSGGDPTVARQKLQDAVATGAGSPLAYYNLAVADLRAGEFGPAEEHAWQAVEQSEGNPKAVRLYVQVMERWGRAEAGVANLERLSERNPDAAGLKLGVIEALLAAKHPADALQRATDLLRKDETNADVMFVMARAYVAMERIEAAEYVLAQLLEIRKDGRAYSLLGTMAWRKGDARKAMGFFQEALKLDPAMADVHNNLAVLYQDAGDSEASAGEALAALQLDPKYSEAWMNLGNARRVQRNFGEAAIAYQEALAANPDCADCEFNFGVLELERKPADQDVPAHYRKAIEHLQRYKAMRRAAPRGDTVADAYIDEARRMAEFLEQEGLKTKEAPPAPSPEDASPMGDPPPPEPAADVPSEGGIPTP